MYEYFLKRLFLAIFTLLTILLASYVLLRLAPGDPTRSNFFGDEGTGSSINAEHGGLMRNEALRKKLHLDRPILTGFYLWMKSVILQGDFGESVAVAPGRSVTQLILERLPITLQLNILSVIVTYLLAIPIGVYSSAHPENFLDRGGTLILFILYSLPVMWVGLSLQSLFCEGGVYPCFPLKGLTPETPERLNIWELYWELIKHYLFPVFCLSYAGFAGLSRYARSSMLEVIHSDFIRTAKAKGVSRRTIIWGHAFRNGMITLITLFGGLLPSLVAGSVLVEYIFNIPGMGSLTLISLSSRDYPLQMALFAFYGFLTLCSLFICDMLYVVVDPRIKLH